MKGTSSFFGVLFTAVPIVSCGCATVTMDGSYHSKLRVEPPKIPLRLEIWSQPVKSDRAHDNFSAEEFRDTFEWALRKDLQENGGVEIDSNSPYVLKVTFSTLNVSPPSTYWGHAGWLLYAAPLFGLPFEGTGYSFDVVVELYFDEGRVPPDHSQSSPLVATPTNNSSGWKKSRKGHYEGAVMTGLYYNHTVTPGKFTKKIGEDAKQLLRSHSDDFRNYGEAYIARKRQEEEAKERARLAEEAKARAEAIRQEAEAKRRKEREAVEAENRKRLAAEEASKMAEELLNKQREEKKREEEERKRQAQEAANAERARKKALERSKGDN